MRAIDVSQWQGVINWSAVPSEIVMMKMSGGDAGLYYDSKASVNYMGATAAGKAVGMYHFAGGGDPIQEADFFIAACSPLAKNDVMVLDWEIAHGNPVGWCQSFIQRVIDKTHTIPIIYMNTSTENTYNWKPIVDMNVGLWVADYRFTAQQNVPIKRWPTYIMHQFTSSGAEPGIGGRVDVNEWFGSKAQFQKYGYQPQVTPPPAPVITTETQYTTEAIPFAKLTVEDPAKDVGYKEVTQVGVDGVVTTTWLVTKSNGVETSRVKQATNVTTPVTNEITTIGTKVPDPDPEPPVPPTPPNLWDVVKAFIQKIIEWLSQWRKS